MVGPQIFKFLNVKKIHAPNYHELECFQLPRYKSEIVKPILAACQITLETLLRLLQKQIAGS